MSFIPVRKLMWLSETNEGPVQLTDYAQNYRLALIYALLDSEYPARVTLKTMDDGLEDEYWLEDE